MTSFTRLNCKSDNKLTQSNIEDLTRKYDYVSNLTQNVNTLNRKSFYESQQYSNLMIWNFWILSLYYVLAIVLVIILFVSENQFQLSTNQKGFATVVLLTYPYVISYIISPLIWVYNFITSFIPYNVYNNL
jgi:hypothetical protein